MRLGRTVTALVASMTLGAAAPETTAAPGLGRFDAELCVATRAGVAPTCGAAQVEVGGRGRVVVRVADIVYELALGASQLDVATMHGAMEIDEFSAPYAWNGDTLTFSDVDKNVRYEVRIGARRSAGGG